MSLSSGAARVRTCDGHDLQVLEVDADGNGNYIVMSEHLGRLQAVPKMEIDPRRPKQ